MGRKLTQDEFIKRSKKVHGNRYDYSKAIYNGDSKQLVVVCIKHGTFMITGGTHMRGVGCPVCSGSVGNTISFKERATSTYGVTYDYSLVNYKKSKEKVKIICKIHGIFEQTPAVHLKGKGCIKCGRIRGGKKIRVTNDKFIINSEKVHGKIYDYSKTIYTKAVNKVTIICPFHGQFKQIPHSHISGHGCPKCNFEVCGWEYST